MIAFVLGARAFLARLPRPVWIALAIAALIGGVAWYHFAAVSDARTAGYAQGKADEVARIEKKAAEWVERINAIAATQRTKNDETNRRIAGDADAMRLSGPGKAACLNPAGTGPGGRVAPARPGDAAVDQMPDTERTELIALPFADALAFAEQHDLCRAEALTWREDKRLQEEAWRKVVD